MIDYTSYQYDSVFYMTESQLKAVIYNELNRPMNESIYSKVDRNPSVDSLSLIYEHMEVCHASLSYATNNGLTNEANECKFKINLLERKEIDTIGALSKDLKPMNEIAMAISVGIALWLAKAEALKVLNTNLKKHRSNKELSESDREKIDLQIKKSEEKLKSIEAKLKDARDKNKDRSMNESWADFVMDDLFADSTPIYETIARGVLLGNLSEDVAAAMTGGLVEKSPFSIYKRTYEESEESYDAKIEAVEDKKIKLLDKRSKTMNRATKRKIQYYIPVWSNILLIFKSLRILVARRKAAAAETDANIRKQKLEAIDAKIAGLKEKLAKEKAKEKEAKAKVMNESYIPNSYWEFANLYEESVVKHDGAKSRIDFFNHITQTLGFSNGLDLIRSAEASGTGVVKNNHTGKLFSFTAKQNADQYFITKMTPVDSSQAVADYHKAMGMMNEEIDSKDKVYHKEMAKLKGEFKKAKTPKEQKLISGKMAALAAKHGKKMDESLKSAANAFRGSAAAVRSGLKAEKDTKQKLKDGAKVEKISPEEKAKRKKWLQEYSKTSEEKEKKARKIGKNATKIEYAYGGALGIKGVDYVNGLGTKQDVIDYARKARKEAEAKYGEAAKKEREEYRKKK